MNPGQQQQLLDLCFSRLYGRFSALVGRLGGKKLEQNLKKIFLAQAKGKGFKKGGTSDVAEVSIDWDDYKKLTDELIRFTSQVAGKNLVEKDIRAAFSDVETETGQRLYEIAFKLGLHRYLDS